MLLPIPATLIFFFILLSILACNKNTIEFGANPENNSTSMVYTDTVDVMLSTVLTDSFPTNGGKSLLLGKYHDPWLGLISATPYFQLGISNGSPVIPATAVFDSLIFIIRTNKYYYGDTSASQTIYINELAESIINSSYNNQLYNTNSVPVKPVPLGQRTIKISPATTDSIIIRLDNTKGEEIFEKLRQLSPDITNDENFQQYFKGISLSTATGDSAVIYGLSANSAMLMRVIYHHTTPVIEEKYIDFPLSANSYVFNRLISERRGTLLPQAYSGLTEIPSAQTGQAAFSQAGLGVFLKMTFPSLRDIIKTDNIIKLVNAELVIVPALQSFDPYMYKLPAKMTLIETNGSNIAGDYARETDGSIKYAMPVIDNIYGENNYYRFNVTNQVNKVLTTTGSNDYGLFLAEEWKRDSMHVNRLIVSDNLNTLKRTRLLLTLLIINK